MSWANAPLRDPLSGSSLVSDIWQRWFTSVFYNVQQLLTKVTSISTDKDEIKTKVYSQADEPLITDGSIAIWRDTTNPSNVVTFLLYRNADSTLKVQLT